MHKTTIVDNFSKSAATYDAHSFIQRRCAKKLIGLLRNRNFSQILEIGCGTGVYTSLLRARYKDANITALDASQEMISFAQKKLQDTDICFMVADGEKIGPDKNFDLITSNAAFQWFEDLKNALKIFREALTDNGILYFSMYGPETFKELGEVFDIHFPRHHPRLCAKGFFSCRDTESILKEHFEEVEIIEERFFAQFRSLRDFLQDIKRSGSRGHGIGKELFLGKDKIRKMEGTYIEKFGRIFATHHVYFCLAQRAPQK